MKQVIARVATPAGAYKGGLVIQSAGNRAVDACSVSYGPAIANDGVIVVGAINNHGQAVRRLNGINGFHNGSLAGSEEGSNHGGCVEMWAPGAEIYSTWKDEGYAYLSGTSMAAPHVAGLAAVLAQPGQTSIQLEAAVRSTLRDLGSSDPADPAIPLKLPTIANPPVSGAYSTTYAEIHVGVVAPSSTGQHNNTLQVHVEGTTATTAPSIYLDSSGIQARLCDVRRRLLPNGGWTSVGSIAPQQVIHGLSWSVGTWEVGSTLCPSARATVIVRQPPRGYWTINGVRQPSGASLTFPGTTGSVLAFESELATQCTLRAYRVESTPYGTVYLIPLSGYPRTVTTPTAAVGLTLVPGLYSYESECTDGSNVPLGNHTAQLLVEITAAMAINPAVGFWWNSQRSGNGMDLRVVGDTLYFTWFTYTAAGTPIWYQGELARQPGRWQGALRRYQWNGSAATPTVIGEATITLTSATRGTLAWQIGNGNGSEPIERFMFGSGLSVPSMSGHWYLPGNSGWGVAVETQGDLHSVVLMVYASNGQPTWVIGVAPGSGLEAAFSLTGTTGTNLCPGCSGASSYVTWPAGTMVSSLTRLHLDRSVTTINAVLAGGIWQRTAIDLARIIGP